MYNKHLNMIIVVSINNINGIATFRVSQPTNDRK